MKLEKAIELLTYSSEHNTILLKQDDKDALKLGIEAMKWRRLMELDYGSWCGPPLPGEDK